LKREKLACVVVAKAEIAGYHDAAANGVEKGFQQRLGVHVWCLNED
jgi:hypothetical protein